MNRPLRGSLTVARRELRAYFSSPWPYGVAAAFLTLTGIVFYVVSDGAREASLRFWFPNLAFVLTITAPVITSRLLSEEWRSRHLDVLLSRAVSPGAVVVGKWLAATAFVIALFVPTLVYVWFLGLWGNPDYPPMVAAYFGAALLAAMFCAVGMLTSSLTPTAVAAGLGSLTLLVALQLASSVRELEKLSFQIHLDSFARGAPAVEDALYFVSATAACLITATAVQIARLRSMDRIRALAVPATAFAVALAVNAVPIPAQARVDLTSTGRYSLSSATQDVLRNVNSEVRVTVFEPEGTAEARDAATLLGGFRRENSKVRYRVLDREQAVGEALRLGADDSGDAVVEAKGRREVVTPITEQGLTSAVQRLVRGTPQQVCALAGHGERELDDPSGGGYQLAHRVMADNGIEARRLDLTIAKSIPGACTILLLPGPTGALLASEITLINAWMEKDGRMMVMGDPGDADLRPITAPWGLRLLPGVVVDPARGSADDRTTLFANRFPSVNPVVKQVSGMTFVGAGGVTTAESDRPGLTVSKIAESSDVSWLELNPTEAKYQPDAGDRGGPVVLAGAADDSALADAGETRVAGGGPRITRTRLLVVADADWAANAVLDQLDNRRTFANALNWLAGQEDLVAVGGEEPDLRRLQLTDGRRQVLGWASIGGLPGLALLGAGVCWLRRRGR